MKFRHFRCCPQLGADQAVVRGRQGEGKTTQKVGEDQPHLHLRKVPAQAVAGCVGKRREAQRLRVPGRHGAPDAGKLRLLEVAVWVELVHVLAPEVRVAVPRPVHDVQGSAARKLRRGTPRAPHVLVILQLAVGAAGNGRPHPQRLCDAAIQIAKVPCTKVTVRGVAAAQRLEERIHLGMETGLNLGVACCLHQEPSHCVSRGVMTSEEDQQHVAV
mmetsp:Transcript_26997/g.61374  ORF Transcript_26997/g.61374 Transcript_26997/m.61374 type:complete len:216 (-) Transcript_26997:89-736(-)